MFLESYLSFSPYQGCKDILFFFFNFCKFIFHIQIIYLEFKFAIQYEIEIQLFFCSTEQSQFPNPSTIQCIFPHQFIVQSLIQSVYKYMGFLVSILFCLTDLLSNPIPHLTLFIIMAFQCILASHRLSPPICYSCSRSLSSLWIVILT